MTSKQIAKALEKAGIEYKAGEVEIEKDEVTVCVGYRLVNERYGECNRSKTKKLAVKIAKALCWPGSSYSTGYGALILQPTAPVDLGDYNSVASRWHY